MWLPPTLHKKPYNRAKQSRRCDLKKGGKKKKLDSQVRSITQYHARHKDMKRAKQKHWNILTFDETLKKHQSVQPSVTYRQLRNIRDILVKGYYSGPSPQHAFRSKGPK